MILSVRVYQRRLGLGGWQLVALGLGGRDYAAGELLRAVNAAGLEPTGQACLAEPAGSSVSLQPAVGHYDFMKAYFPTDKPELRDEG